MREKKCSDYKFYTPVYIYLHGQTCRGAAVCLIENLVTLKDFMDNFCVLAILLVGEFQVEAKTTHFSVKIFC